MDGSSRYIYSNAALERIRHDSPDAKIIVCLRNPVDLLYSLHNHLVFLGVEREKDFLAAWEHSLNFNRAQLVSEGNSDPDSLDYPRMGRIGSRVAELKEYFPSGQLHLVFYDDIVLSPSQVNTDILAFLGIEQTKAAHIGHDNKSMARKSELIFKVTSFVAKIKRVLGVRISFGLLNAIQNKKLVYYERPPLESGIYARLQRYFEDDIRLLEQVANRDLSSWTSS